MSEQRIKLIQVIADSALGGGPKHVLGILKHINQKKFEPFLICPPGYLQNEAKKIDGIQVFSFDPKSKFDLVSVYYLHRTFERIRSLSDPFAPIIVHTHGPRAGLMARMVVPFGAKKVHTEHRFDDDFHLKNPINEYLQKKVLAQQNKKSDLIIAVSSSVRKYLINSNAVPKSKIVVIPNAIEFENESRSTDKKIKVSNKAPIIGTIGNLNVQKGQTYLIEALSILRKKYPLITLEIVGEGPERNDLTEQIKITKLEHHVSLLGQKKDIEKYLHHWDVFVLSSIAETFGIVILEAMEAGVPVVASNVGGIPDIITNKKNGLLVPVRSPKAIALAVEQMIDHPTFAAKLKREARERLTDFDWTVVIKKLEEEYQGIV